MPAALGPGPSPQRAHPVTADVLGPRALLAADRTLVEKPFTPESLTRKVRQTLDAAPATAGD